MGTLIPGDFDLMAIVESERRVLEALIAGTDPGWLILPNVPYVENGKDGEADIVLLNANFGAVVVEVKGGAIAVRNGGWFQNEHRLRKSPVQQAVDARYALKRKAAQVTDVDGAGMLEFTHAVAFPDAQAVPHGWLGPDLEQRMIFTNQELVWAGKALETLIEKRTRPATAATMKSVVRAFRPDLNFEAAIGDHFEIIGRRLDEDTEAILRIAEKLDSNKRLSVTGPAGSGKSRLGMRWAQRANERGESVLFLSYNIPIGADFARKFDDDPNVTAGNFHDVALRLLEQTGFKVPESPTTKFWEEEVSDALFDRRDQLGRGFDTIILDEVQDFKPEWIVALEELLDPEGARRFYLLGDPAQTVYGDHGKDSNYGADGFATFELSTNCRNTKAIAAVATHLSDANDLKAGAIFPTSPEGEPVHFVAVGALKELRKRLGAELLRLQKECGFAPSDISIITTRADLRDNILDPPIVAAKLVRWHERDEMSVVCETAHRLKGTETAAVILVSLEPVTTDWLPAILYVGVTRATTMLSVIAPRETGTLLGLTAS